MPRSTFRNNRETAIDFLNAVDRIYVVDAYANWDPKVDGCGCCRHCNATQCSSRSILLCVLPFCSLCTPDRGAQLHKHCTSS